MKNQRGNAFIGILLFILLFIVFFGAWLTHVVVCLKSASWGFLIAGAIFFPVGLIHGWGIWLGVF